LVLPTGTKLLGLAAGVASSLAPVGVTNRY